MAHATWRKRDPLDWLKSCLLKVDSLLDRIKTIRAIRDEKEISHSTSELVDQLQSLKKILGLYKDNYDFGLSRHRDSKVESLLVRICDGVLTSNHMKLRALFTNDKEKEDSDKLAEIQSELAEYTFTLRFLYSINKSMVLIESLESITRLLRDDHNLPFDIMELVDQIQSFQSIVYAYQRHISWFLRALRDKVLNGIEAVEIELRFSGETMAKLIELLQQYEKLALSEGMKKLLYKRQWSLKTEEEKGREVVQLQHKLAAHISKLRSQPIEGNTEK